MKPPLPSKDNKLSLRSTNQKPARGPIGSCGGVPGKLGRIEQVDLWDDERTQILFHRAVKTKLVKPGDRLNVFAAAEHAQRIGERNPAGLFVWLIVNRRWDYVTQADEDAAQMRLQRMRPSERLVQSKPAHNRDGGASARDSATTGCSKMVRASSVLQRYLGDGSTRSAAERLRTAWLP